MVSFTPLLSRTTLVAILLARLGACDDANNFCSPAITQYLPQPPAGLLKYSLPRIQGAYVDLVDAISVRLDSVDGSGNTCVWNFKNSGTLRKQIWYSDFSGPGYWLSQWVYPNNDPKAIEQGDGCIIQTSCDKDNEGVRVGTVS